MSSGSRAETADTGVFSSSEIGRTEGRYLLAVHQLSDPTTDRITTGELRELLGVSAASVSEMIFRLDERGLVDHEKYHGVTLTSRGSSVTEELAWRLCIVKNFFSLVLETELDDEILYEISVVLPESGVFNLRELINRPCIDSCPEANFGCGKCAT